MGCALPASMSVHMPPFPGSPTHAVDTWVFEFPVLIATVSTGVLLMQSGWILVAESFSYTPRRRIPSSWLALYTGVCRWCLLSCRREMDIQNKHNVVWQE